MVFPVRIAVNFKIPLIIWGVHQGVDQVGMFSHHDMVEMNRRYRIEHDLMGYEAEEFIGKRSNMKKEDLSPDFAGIRPKIWLNENPMPDFYISHEADKGYPGWVNLIGIESPGLTSAIAIGEDVASWII